MSHSSENKLNVLFSSDDNYAQHLGAAMYSLLHHNQDFELIHIYIIDNEISEESKHVLQDIVNGFQNAKVTWISFRKWKQQLKLNMAWNISISTYARLFVADMLPNSVERVLYLDCDMIICQSLYDMWNIDLKDNVLGAVQDTINDKTKLAVGLKAKHPYFNAGMLLIDLNQWRALDVENKCLAFIEENNGQVVHHDQGTLNGVLKGKWKRLSLSCNLMTIHYIFKYHQIEKYFKDHAEFYSLEEISQAKHNPIIIHYTPSFTSRPWVKDCKHPYKKYYWSALNQTPWKGAKSEKNPAKWYVKLIDWRYRNLPY